MSYFVFASEVSKKGDVCFLPRFSVSFYSENELAFLGGSSFSSHFLSIEPYSEERLTTAFLAKNDVSGFITFLFENYSFLWEYALVIN